MTTVNAGMRRTHPELDKHDFDCKSLDKHGNTKFKTATFGIYKYVMGASLRLIRGKVTHRVLAEATDLQTGRSVAEIACACLDEGKGLPHKNLAADLDTLDFLLDRLAGDDPPRLLALQREHGLAPPNDQTTVDACTKKVERKTKIEPDPELAGWSPHSFTDKVQDGLSASMSAVGRMTRASSRITRALACISPMAQPEVVQLLVDALAALGDDVTLEIPEPVVDDELPYFLIGFQNVPEIRKVVYNIVGIDLFRYGAYFTEKEWADRMPHTDVETLVRAACDAVLDSDTSELARTLEGLDVDIEARQTKVED